MRKTICLPRALRHLVRDVFMLVIGCASWLVGAHAAAIGSDQPRVAILAYHRFDSARAVDSMTVRVTTFEAQLRFLREHGYRIVTLPEIVKWLATPDATLPEKAVAFTADDGHRSVYEVLMPIAVREHLPFTLFIYPSAISNASYALTWAQLKALQQTGLFDVQSHTYWHPNFNIERARRSPDDFRRFVEKQLVDSRNRLHAELGVETTMLAWPFGIVDPELTSIAASTGYRAAFTIAGHMVDKHSPPLAVSRLLITDADTPSVLARRLGESQTGALPAPATGRLP
ncbi:MAG: polysaccharide deacetylase family protein [Paraburkholderia sp.]|nr:MAG: polysaccharide deacetylase family protein [Paraburkholderia sp.]